jgi:glycosyltransferase involved in cell wall biosynthesis
MNIVHLTQYFQPKLGYNDLYIPLEQQMMGQKVSIVTSDRYAPNVSFFRNVVRRRVVGSGIFCEEGLHVYRLPFLFEFGNLSAISGVGKVLKKINPDIVHCHDIFSLSLIEAALYKQSIGFSLIADSITGTFQPKGIKELAFLTHKYAIFPILRKKVDCFIAISNGSQRWLQENMKITSNNYRLIPLGADMDLFVHNSLKRNEIRRFLGLSEDDVLIVYSGKILPDKDIKELILAMASLRKIRKNIHLIIVGSGPHSYMDEISRILCRHGLSDRVHFYPPVKRTKLADFYSAADIGVWPGSPSNSIIEAMSTGLPIIIAGYHPPRHDAYDTSHLLEYDNGLSFQRGKINELESCLEKMAISKFMRMDMGLKSRRLVEEKLNWHKIAENTLNLYSSILKGQLKMSN